MDDRHSHPTSILFAALSYGIQLDTTVPPRGNPSIHEKYRWSLGGRSQPRCLYKAE